MVKQTTPEPEMPITSESRLSLHDFLQISFVCLTPLLWLVLIVGSILLIAFLIHYLTLSEGFLYEQQINVITVSSCLWMSILVYIIGIVYTLRKIRQWEREGRKLLAIGGLWGLGMRAIAFLLLLLVFFFIVH